MQSATQLRARPEEEDFAHKYTNEGSGKIGGMLINNYFKAVKQLFEMTDLPSRMQARAIEIGCGEGFSTQRLRKLLPDNVALEASEYVGHLVPRAEQNNPGLRISQESVYQTNHANGSFDLIFLLEVLEHLDYPDQALAELSRIMRKDGYLILGVPREPLWCMLNMARGTYLKSFGNTPGHLNHWSTFTLKRYLGKHFGPILAVKTPLPWTLVVARRD